MCLKAIAVNGSLKSSSSNEQSSTAHLLTLMTEELNKYHVSSETIQLADHTIKPRVTSDTGDAMTGQVLGENSRRRYCNHRNADGSARPPASPSARSNGWTRFWKSR